MCDTWGDPPWCRKAIEPARRRDAAHLFFQLVCRRYESKSILVTSNRSLSDWGMVFGDPTVATAILDRLLHHCTPVTIMGDSYRIREAKKKKNIGLRRGTPRPVPPQTEPRAVRFASGSSAPPPSNSAHHSFNLNP